MNDDYQTWDRAIPAYLHLGPPERESGPGRSTHKYGGYLETEGSETSHRAPLTLSSLENEIVVHLRRFHLGCHCCSTRYHYRISSSRGECNRRSAANYRGHQECMWPFRLPLWNLILTSGPDLGFHSVNNRGWVGHRARIMPGECQLFALTRPGYHSVQWSFQSRVKWEKFLREFHSDDSEWFLDGSGTDSFRSVFLGRSKSSVYAFFKKRTNFSPWFNISAWE